MQIRRSGRPQEQSFACSDTVSKHGCREFGEAVSRARRAPREATAAGRVREGWHDDSEPHQHGNSTTLLCDKNSDNR